MVRSSPEIALVCWGCGEPLVVVDDQVGDGRLTIWVRPCLTCLTRYPTADKLEDALTGTIKRLAEAAMQPKAN